MSLRLQEREMAIDEAKLQAFLGRSVGDMAAAISGAMVDIGHKWASTRQWLGPARWPPLN